MSGLAMDRNHGQHGAGPHDSSHITDEHSDHEHVEDDVAPLREVRPKSSRGLLRKDTPAVLDTTSLRKGLLTADIHHSPQVTEEEEGEEEDDRPIPNKRQTAPVIRLESTWQSHTDRSRSKSTKTNNSTSGTITKDTNSDNNKTGDDVISTTDNKDTVDTMTSSSDKNNRNIGVSNDCESTKQQNTRPSKAQPAPTSHTVLENTTTGADVDSVNDEGPRGITVEYCDGTRPKVPPVQASNGGVKGCVRMIEARTELEKQMNTTNKVKKPAVTFKERHSEGFHAHTKSGMKVLMRKETPASLPSVQKVKAAQRFRQTSESLVEEIPRDDDELEDENDDEIAEALAGACGEG